MDLSAALPATISPGQRALIDTGLRISIPDGWEGQVRPRSGLAARNGVTVLNAPGTIDADYRGVIKVVLHNAGWKAYRVEPGARIAQLVIAPVSRVRIQEGVIDTKETRRGDRGFGSTGVCPNKGTPKQIECFMLSMCEDCGDTKEKPK